MLRIVATARGRTFARRLRLISELPPYRPYFYHPYFTTPLNLQHEPYAALKPRLHMQPINNSSQFLDRLHPILDFNHPQTPVHAHRVHDTNLQNPLIKKQLQPILPTNKASTLHGHPTLPRQSNQPHLIEDSQVQGPASASERVLKACNKSGE